MRLRDIILEKLAELGEATIGSFFPEKYPEGRLWRNLLKADKNYSFSRRSFSSLLSQLRRQGLVEHMGKRHDGAWRLTSKGNSYLEARKEKYAKPGEKEDGVERLVIFDIPEAERVKRRVIRGKLLGMGYLPLQKSVWRGKVPIRKDFLELLDELELQGKVHIFSINELGTIGRV